MQAILPRKIKTILKINRRFLELFGMLPYVRRQPPSNTKGKALKINRLNRYTLFSLLGIRMDDDILSIVLNSDKIKKSVKTDFYFINQEYNYYSKDN